MIDHHDDLHLAVEFLNRAAVMRDEIGVAAYRRAMHQALVALGDTVIAEAERMAGASARARAPSGTVVPFGRTSRAIRRAGDAADPDPSKSCRRRRRPGDRFRPRDTSGSEQDDARSPKRLLMHGPKYLVISHYAM